MDSFTPIDRVALLEISEEIPRNILDHCLITLIITPRLEILSNTMAINKLLSESYPNSNFEYIESRLKQWLFSHESKDFINGVQEAEDLFASFINGLYLEVFNKDETKIQSIEKKIFPNLMKAWMKGTIKKETVQFTPRISSYEEQLRDQEANIIANQAMANQGLFKQSRKIEKLPLQEEEQPVPLSKSQKALLAQKQYVDLSNLVKEDKQKETDAIELETILSLETQDPAIRERIRSAWLNQVYFILKSKSVVESCKLPNISSRMSRIVIQVFFTAIHTGSNIDKVYSTIFSIIKNKGILDRENFVAPLMIIRSETVKIPRIEIVRIMDSILDAISHEDDLLRKNWERLSSLRIDISELMRKMTSDRISPDIIIEVSRIYSDKTKVKGGTTIEKLGPSLHARLKHKYTLEHIKSMMKYTN
jgi:hypothetical protein